MNLIRQGRLVLKVYAVCIVKPWRNLLLGNYQLIDMKCCINIKQLWNYVVTIYGTQYIFNLECFFHFGKGNWTFHMCLFNLSYNIISLERGIWLLIINIDSVSNNWISITDADRALSVKFIQFALLRSNWKLTVISSEKKKTYFTIRSIYGYIRSDVNRRSWVGRMLAY